MSSSQDFYCFFGDVFPSALKPMDSKNDENVNVLLDLDWKIRIFKENTDKNQNFGNFNRESAVA